jgi:hypothetical protein
MRLATRSGLSLPRSECPFQDHLYGITVPLPASSLPPGAVPDPFGRGLLPSVPVSREPGRDHRLQPVAWLTLRSPASPQALLPFGTRPSGSPLGSIRRRGAYFSKRPVTFRSPPAATCYSTADGSTFQARLRLSKLLSPCSLSMAVRSPCAGITQIRSEGCRFRDSQLQSRCILITGSFAPLIGSIQGQPECCSHFAFLGFFWFSCAA